MMTNKQAGCVGILLFIVILLISRCAEARDHHEKWYQQQWCYVEQNAALKVEPLSDGTWPDCLSLAYAIEVDFADKAWKEGIGQALHYAIMTGKQPGVLVIMESQDDCRYLARVERIGELNYPQIMVWETGAWAGRCD